MTRLPRDLDGADLADRLGRLGYRIVRQRGSHIRLAHPGPPEAHLTVPCHAPLKIGTLAGILDAVAEHLHSTRQDLLDRLLG